MNPAIINSQFVQIALPIIITFVAAAWLNGKSIEAVGKRIDDLRSEMNRRFDDVNRRFDDVNKRFEEVFRRLDNIDGSIMDYGQRIVRLEEKPSLLSRMAK